MFHTDNIRSKIDDSLDAGASVEGQVNTMINAIHRSTKDFQQFGSEIVSSRVLMGKSWNKKMSDESEKNGPPLLIELIWVGVVSYFSLGFFVFLYYFVLGVRSVDGR